MTNKFYKIIIYIKYNSMGFKVTQIYENLKSLEDNESKLSRIRIYFIAIVKNAVFGLDWQDYLVVELLYQFSKDEESAVDLNGITSFLLRQPRKDRNRYRTSLLCR